MAKPRTRDATEKEYRKTENSATLQPTHLHSTVPPSSGITTQSDADVESRTDKGFHPESDTERNPTTTSSRRERCLQASPSLAIKHRAFTRQLTRVTEVLRDRVMRSAPQDRIRAPPPLEAENSQVTFRHSPHNPHGQVT